MNRLTFLILPILFLTIRLSGCEGSAPISLNVTRDLVYGKVIKRTERFEVMLDIYAPTEPGEWPIVIYLHDFGETRADSTPLVKAIAAQGAIVFNIDYPDIDPTVAILNQGKGHRELDEIVACAVRFARARALDYGSENAPVALAGFSYGGGVASHVALMGNTVEERWEEYAAVQDGPPCQCECGVTEGSSQVDALVGIAGAYDAFVGYDGKYGREFIQDIDPELWQMLYSAVGENTDLKIRLLHSQSDQVIPYQNSVSFESIMGEAGYDVNLIPFTGGHTTPLEPTVQTIMDVLAE